MIVEAVKEGCEYVVVQIDTDVSSQYGVENNPGDVQAFWAAIKDKLTGSVHPDFPKDKLIFAICIQEIECWLIPFVSTIENECQNTDRCLNIVNRHIRTKGSIDKQNKNSQQAQRHYQYILGRKKKPLEIKDCSRYNFGFKELIEQLDEFYAVLEQ